MGFLKSLSKSLSGGSFFSGSGFDFNGSISPGSLADMLNGKTATDYQNKLNIENWNMQNAYNTPLAQMQRYKEAGLNPNLIYSQSNMAGSVSSPSAPDTSGPQKILSGLSAIYGLKNMAAQNANIKSQNSLINSQAEFTAEQAKRYAYETKKMMEGGYTSFDIPIARTAGNLFQTAGRGYINYVDTLDFMFNAIYDYFSNNRNGQPGKGRLIPVSDNNR